MSYTVNLRPFGPFGVGTPKGPKGSQIERKTSRRTTLNNRPIGIHVQNKGLQSLIFILSGAIKSMYDQFKNNCGDHRTNAKHTQVRSSVFAGMRVRESASRCELLRSGVFAGTQVRASIFKGTHKCF